MLSPADLGKRSALLQAVRRFFHARDYLEAEAAKAMEAARALGVEDSLVNFEGLTPQMLEALGKDGVKTLEDFATCADWELAAQWSEKDGVMTNSERRVTFCPSSTNTTLRPPRARWAVPMLPRSTRAGAGS